MSLVRRLMRLPGGLPERSYSLLAAALALAAGGGLVLLIGPQLAPDSRTYFDQATLLTEGGLDPFLEGVLGWPYLAVVATVAAAKGLFGAGWWAAMIGLNLTCLAATGALVGRLVHRLVEGPWLRLAGLMLLPAGFDVLLWNRFVCTEPLFTLLLVGAISLAAERLSVRRGVLLGVLLLAMVAWRPTGLVFVAALGLGAALPGLAWGLQRWRGRPSGRLALAIWLAGLLAIALTFAAIMRHPGLWPFGPLKAQFDYARWSYDLGQVVWGRHETYHPRPHGYLDYLAIALDRCVHAFALWADGHSLVHRLYSLLYLGPLFALTAWALGLWSAGGRGLTPAQGRFAAVAGGAALAFILLVALLQVEFDWRYRAPVLPVLMVVALVGASALAGRTARPRGGA
ncbi:MAG: hypothetical protein Q7T61_13120 [Caulobacter sp.]|nr:hypothetical protein [Caulobacter sp.]